MTYCCEELRSQVEYSCAVHPNRWDCPDCLLVRSARGALGLMIHDGGTSSIRIHFCPWCGARLPDAETDPGRDEEKLTG